MKICFLSMHYKTPQIYLDTIVKMTPGRKGIWKNLEAITDPHKADFVFITDGYSGSYPADRAIFIGEHPTCSGLFSTWKDKPALLRFSLNKYLNPGEWWIDNDYDSLMALKPPEKKKKAICVMTYQTHTPIYRQRPIFVGELLRYYKDLDVYGRPSHMFIADSQIKENYRGFLGKDKPDGTLGEHLIGKEIIKDYCYTLEFDVGPTVNYASERFYDSLLLWCMPVYFGSSNISDYIVKEAFHTIDIHNMEHAKRVAEVFNSDSREQNIEAIAKARDQLLNRYQLWAYAEDIINNIDKYKKEQGA